MTAVRRVDFYPADYLGGVSGMTAELMGVYWMICTLLYMSDGMIQTDDHRLKTNAGVSHQRLPGALRELVKMRKIDISNDGAITQQKVSEELSRAELRITKAQANGKQGGRPSSDINDLGKPPGIPDEKLTRGIHQPSDIIQQSKERSSNDDQKKKGCRLPEDWEPTYDDRVICQELRLDPDEILAEFTDYWIAVPGQRGVKLDWSATWRNWCRKQAKAETKPKPKSAPYLVHDNYGGTWDSRKVAVGADGIPRWRG